MRERSVGRLALVLALSLLFTVLSSAEVRAGGERAILFRSSTTDYRDTRWDPDAGTAPDGLELSRIDSTTRAARTGADGRRWLRLVVAPFDRYVGTETRFHLDTDGDRIADFVVAIWSADLEGQGCWVQELNGGPRTDGRRRDLEPGDYPRWGAPAACRVPLALLRPSERIAWWAGVRVFGGDAVRTYDRAPDSGWYR